VGLPGKSESIQIWGLRRLSFTLLDREIGVPTAEYTFPRI
jgi:hypothetical protein